jgi:hypothetical protein
MPQHFRSLTEALSIRNALNRLHITRNFVRQVLWDTVLCVRQLQWQICTDMFHIPSLFSVISHSELSKHTAISTNFFDALCFELHYLYAMLCSMLYLTEKPFSLHM